MWVGEGGREKGRDQRLRETNQKSLTGVWWERVEEEENTLERKYVSTGSGLWFYIRQLKIKKERPYFQTMNIC